jgi:hypothetical protein
MTRTVEDTAILVKLLLVRSDQKRARISEKTIKLVARRQRLKAGFIRELQSKLDDHGLLLVELSTGGYGLVTSSALEGAPTITAKKYMLDDLSRLRKDPTKAMEAIRREIDVDEPIDENDD